MTTQSKLTAATAAEGAMAATAAINQLPENQSAMMQMMAYANMTRANKRPRTRLLGGGQSNTQVQWHQHLCPLPNSTFPTSSRAVNATVGGGQVEAIEEQEAREAVPHSTIQVGAFPHVYLARASMQLNATRPRTPTL